MCVTTNPQKLKLDRASSATSFCFFLIKKKKKAALEQCEMFY